jgi:signal transduction histidine kinase/DNA-binding response OmpR family regulator
MKTIGTKFFVASGTLALLFAGLLWHRTSSSARRHMEELASMQGKIALEFDLAIRAYVAESIRPAMQERIAKDEFVVEAMSTSYIARRVFDRVGQAFPDYIIKFSSENPRNPRNLAGDEEKALLRMFAERPKIQQWNGTLEMDGSNYLAHASPMRIEQDCLQCHGRPEEAPRSLLTRYGSTAGFGKRLGEVAGMDLVAVPMERVTRVLAKDVGADLAITVLWLVVFLAGILVIFRVMVSRRLAGITRHFQVATAGEASESRFAPITVRGRDEISSLARSFNMLMARVRELQESLEDRVQQRTEQLSKANAQLATAKEAAESSNRAKSQFLANVSHEIRTPMTAVLGMNTLMLNTSLNPEQKDYAETIHHSAETLLALLNDILDFSKMEADKLDLEMIPFALKPCAKKVGGIFSSRATEKGIDLRMDFDPELPEFVRGDPGRCQQVLMNLISNAIKFTESGEVVLRMRRGHQAAKPRHVPIEVEVRDTGVGMTSSEQKRLLKPFAQADVSTTRRYGGSGLGLVICRRLVELMGGQLSLESRVGEGTSVRFCVELEEVDEPGVACPDMGTVRTQAGEVAPSNGSRRRALRVLVAEDTVANQKLLRHLLQKAGHVCDVVSNGVEAVSALEKGRYDLVLMDCQMPVMDGYEATRRIRQLEGESRQTIIIALTASAMKGDREACLAAGMNEYLTKPVILEALLAVLGRYAPRLVEPAPESQATKVGVPARIETEDLPVDLGALREMIGTDPAVLQDMLIAFMEENRQRVADLQAAQHSGDAEAVRRAAHGVKSAALNFHAARLAELARILEDRGQAGELEGLDPTVSALGRELERIERVLDSSGG